MRNFKYLFMGVLLLAFSAMTSVSAVQYVKDGDLTAFTAPVGADTLILRDTSTGNTLKVTIADIYASAGNIGAGTIVTVGALDSGSITSNFGTINTGASDITTTGDITGGTHAATGDTSTGDNSSMGYTASEGIILTGQGTTNDVTIKNDADADVLVIPTGTTNVDIVGVATAATFEPDGDTSAADNAAIGNTATEGIVITGQGSTYDVVIKNDADAIVISILTGTTGVVFAGATDVSSGTVTGPSGTWDSGGVDIATTDTYAIAGTNVIDNATTFTSTMVTSSLTAVGALNSGSITSGFTSIDVGAGAILTTGVVTGDSVVATAGTITIADGGTVSQGAGSGRATTVVLNTYSGQITTDTTSLAAGAEATFTVTNSVVTALDVVCVSFGDIPDADAMHVISVTATGSGSFEITYSNVSGNADTGANVINFVVLRGASS